MGVPTVAYKAGNPILFVGFDDSCRLFLESWNGIGHRQGLVSPREHSQVVFMVSKYDQGSVFQSLHALETQDTPVLGGAGIVDGQPVPSR